MAAITVSLMGTTNLIVCGTEPPPVHVAAWLQEDWIDPYHNSDKVASDDPVLDLDLYHRLHSGNEAEQLVAPRGRSGIWSEGFLDGSHWSTGLTPLGESFGNSVSGGENAWSDETAATWQLQWLPDGLVYSPPLADPKASRLGLRVFHERDDGWLYDATLGATTGILRYGTLGTHGVDGWQLDLEGSAQVRIDLPEELDVRSADYRAGVPITFGLGRWRSRLGYYHLSSHLGDEYLLKNPNVRRLNYVRDVLYINQSLYLTEGWRVYADAGWAFHSDIANEWEFQFGSELVAATSWLGARPFLAANAQLRQELDYGGNFNAQAGWIWRAPNGRRLRAGFHYYNGHSNQWSFFQAHEEQIGVGIWLDR